MPGMIIFLDINNAFSVVNGLFLLKFLGVFNVGPFLKGCVNLQYRNIWTCASNNGYASSFINPQSGIHQVVPWLHFSSN